MVSYLTDSHRFTNVSSFCCTSASLVYPNPNSVKWVLNMPQQTITPYSYLSMCSQSMPPADQCFQHTLPEGHYHSEVSGFNQAAHQACLTQSLSAQQDQHCTSGTSLTQQSDSSYPPRSNVSLSEADRRINPAYTIRLSTFSSPTPEDNCIYSLHDASKVDWTNIPGHLECVVFGRQCDVDPLLTDITSHPEPLVFSRSELATYISLTNRQLQLCPSPVYSSCQASPLNHSFTSKLCPPSSPSHCSPLSSQSSNSPPAKSAFSYLPPSPKYRFAQRESRFFRSSRAPQPNAALSVAGPQRTLNRRRTLPVSASFLSKRKSPAAVTTTPTTTALRYGPPHRFMKRSRWVGLQPLQISSPTATPLPSGPDSTATDEGYSDTVSFLSSSRSSAPDPHHPTSHSPISSTDSYSSPYVFHTSPPTDHELEMSELQAPKYQVVPSKPDRLAVAPKSSYLHGYKRLQLLNFIIQLLEEPSSGTISDSPNPSGGCLYWVDRSARVFSIKSPEGLAKLWGQYRNNQNMTFESLCRSLRLYYRSGKLERVRNQRYQYRLLGDGHSTSQFCSSTGTVTLTSASTCPTPWGHGRLQLT